MLSTCNGEFPQGKKCTQCGKKKEFNLISQQLEVTLISQVKEVKGAEVRD